MVVEMMGGLGNQMFVYAFAKALELGLGGGKKVVIDGSAYRANPNSSIRVVWQSRILISQYRLIFTIDSIKLQDSTQDICYMG